MFNLANSQREVPPMPQGMITDLPSAARSLIATAIRVLASQDGQAFTEAVLRHYRDDARAVVVAVLRDLAGGPSGGGVVTTRTAGVIRLDELADAIARGAEE
jgi:hypothetical protein